MITAQFSLKTAGEAQRAHSYRVASHLVATDISVNELASFEATHSDQASLLPAHFAASDATGGEVVFRGNGLIAGKQREVECKSGPAGYRLAISGVGLFTVSCDGRATACIEPQTRLNLVTETMLGPALILALALQGVWCLHASAVAIDDSVIAFVGESGRGKSTLARFAHQNLYTDWRRVADDVMPISTCSHETVALPHFPQLKLRPEDQFARNEPERMRLKAIYLLDEPKAEEKEIKILPLTPREAILAIVRHTHAARLFDKKLMARHLAFCTATSAGVPARRLCFPREFALLPDVIKAIRADSQTI